MLGFTGGQILAGVVLVVIPIFIGWAFRKSPTQRHHAENRAARLKSKASN
jgi:hypothetical protein